MENLIVKYFQKTCSDEEKKALFDWIDADAANKNYYRQIRNLWDVNLISEAAGDEEQNGITYLKLIKELGSSSNGLKPSRFRHIMIRASKMAAVAVISFAIAWVCYSKAEQNREIAWQTIEVPVGQRVLISLADGSSIWLNSMTKFSYPESFSKNKRMVKLDGEAYFEVIRNDKLPFEVETAQVDIKVKGTKFNLYAYRAQPNTETTLVEGKVLMAFAHEGLPEVEMMPNQKAIYTQGSAMPEIINNVDTEIETSWTRGVYNFKDITFDKLIGRLEHYFDMKITVKREDILAYRCTGKFLYDETIKDILDVVKTSKPFKYKIEDRLITIY